MNARRTRSWTVLTRAVRVLVFPLAAVALAGCHEDLCRIAVAHGEQKPICGEGAPLNERPRPTRRLQVSDLTPLVGHRVTFTAVAEDRDNDPVRFEWDFDGDGDFEVEESPRRPSNPDAVEDGATARWTSRVSTRYRRGGWVRVTVRLSDFPGSSAEISGRLRVHTPDEFRESAPPIARFTTFPEGFASELGQRQVFDGGESFDPDGHRIVAWRWTFGDGVELSRSEFHDWRLDKAILHQYSPPPAPGGYTATLTVWDETGRRSAPAEQTILPSRRPGRSHRSGPTAILDIEPNPARVGETVSFSAAGSSDPDGDIVRYLWDLDGDGVFDRTTEAPRTTRAFSSPTAVLAVQGVQLWVFDAEGNSARDSETFRVNAGSPPTARLEIDPVPAQVGETVTFSAAGSTDPDENIYSYEWDLDGNRVFETTTGAEAQATRSYSSPARIVARVRVTDLELQTDTAFREVVIEGGDTRGATAATLASAHGTRGAAGKLGPARAFSTTVRGDRLTSGRFRARLVRVGRLSWAERTLRGFLRTAWRSRAKVRRDDESGRVTVRALAVAKATVRKPKKATHRPRGRRSAAVCLRLRIRLRPGEPPTGALRVISGTGRAARLRGSASFRFTVRPDGSAPVRGHLRAGRGAKRPLSQACRALSG